jgi:catechol 2,3-dioxygenase-like lactoylglutathione lyase family enzyme
VARFRGFDHIDTRVRDLALVEKFYDDLMPELGLSRKTFAFVDAAGEWQEPTVEHPYNTIEFHEEGGPADRPHGFIGFIEDRSLRPNATRIAFAVGTRDELHVWEPRLRELGARAIEFSDDMDGYPALFFEDPAGTRLELCARNRRPD